MSYVKGKIALITGASSGIGAAVARVFGEAGIALVLAARRKDRLDALAQEINDKGGKALAVECDVTDEAAVERLFATALEAYGRLDLLINNAGIADHTPTDELSLARWQEVVDVNLTAAFLCARAALRIMKRQQGGRMLHIGSLSAQVPRPNTAAYAATKFGLAGLNHSLAIDGREHGVASCIYHPGVVGTELARRGPPGDPLRSQGAEATARMILAMCDLPDHVNFFEGTSLPITMPFLGRG